MEEKKFVITQENVSEYCEKIGHWIKKNIENAKSNGVVLGMSSGVDCSIVARLCQNAGINTHLILMPYGNDMTNSKSYSDAMELINKFKFDYHIFDIKPAVDNLQIPENSKILGNASKTNIELSRANIRPRVRMTYLYEYAQINNLLVIGTSNLSERTVGYFTKWGDGAHDFNPISDLTVTEIYEFLHYLNAPQWIMQKAPSAALFDGQTDETEMGITYAEIDSYINGENIGPEKSEIIIKLHETSAHKRCPIITFDSL